VQRRDAGIALLLASLCVLAYAPTLTIPLSSDDYPNITQSLVFGPWSGLPALFTDAVFRLRSTSYWAMYLMWQAFHLTPVAYHVFSLLLHIANTLLLYQLARTPAPDPRSLAPVLAGGFFAIHEGHQEAVMWFSAISELLMFLFGMAALLCWKRSRVLSLLLFALALISKESAIIFLPLFALRIGWRRDLLPYALLTAVAIVSIAVSRATSFRFSDGSFSLHAPFYITWPRSYFRELWIWGWIALIFLWAQTRRVQWLPLVWIGIALIPYSFLTYQTAIPSRQTYLASAGLAWLVGEAFVLLPDSRRLQATLLVAIVAHNFGILWIRKRAQFLERARPTQELIAFARSTPGPIWVRCFPEAEIIAREAVHLGADQLPSILIWTEAEAAQSKPAATFCYH